jgi:TorA maturation chaperone TorD
MPPLSSGAHTSSEAVVVTTPAEEDRIRGNVYALLGNLLAGPPDANLLQLLQDISPDSDDESVLAASWQMLAATAARANPDALREEYDALFIGIARGEIVPYASWYLTGFLMEQPLADLRGDLQALGIQRHPGVHEPEDHVAALCDTMALLIHSDAPTPLDDQYRFFSRHLEPWVARFFGDLQQAKSAEFYRAVAQLGEQFIGIETQAFRAAVPAAGVAKHS